MWNSGRVEKWMLMIYHFDSAAGTGSGSEGGRVVRGRGTCQCLHLDVYFYIADRQFLLIIHVMNNYWRYDLDSHGRRCYVGHSLAVFLTMDAAGQCPHLPRAEHAKAEEVATFGACTHFGFQKVECIKIWHWKKYLLNLIRIYKMFIVY